MRADRLLLAQRQNGFLGGLPLQGFEVGAAEFGEVKGTLGRGEQNPRARLLSVRTWAQRFLTHLADGREHIDGGSEVSDVEDGQVQLDVAVVPCAFRRILSARQTCCALLVRSLP